jgi:hypothetical protein
MGTILILKGNCISGRVDTGRTSNPLKNVPVARALCPPYNEAKMTSAGKTQQKSLKEKESNAENTFSGRQ